MREYENEDKSYPIRAYSKEELAMLYSPNQCITVALQTMARWIRMNKLLVKELDDVGYNKYRRTFTPREVKLLFKYLGEPG